MIKRLVPLAALVALLAGCGGNSLTSPPPATAAPVGGDLGSIDACSLLEAADLPDEKLVEPGKPLSEPRSCEWKLETATVRVVVLQSAFDDVERYERRTEELTLEGRRAWRGVETRGNTSTAIYVTELSPDYTLDVRAERTPAGYSIDKVARPAVTAVLKRLDRRS
ncbi:hypothetical protein SAMN05216553_104223 [Lentzea fradiae]|uniref:DUF3558 domain-containing protein n=1 Tax=Lentzea fradiae TaxID=200378 RepID=A0A1G7Q2R3_9PSEU|nr:hypothetical protein [Lentzea fradiae]SDF92862.1 hypothetical protein SAMN05216553_104223 [Lentzea fradiae]